MQFIPGQMVCRGVMPLYHGVQTSVGLLIVTSFPKQQRVRRDGSGLSGNSFIKKQEVILQRQEILSILIKAGWENLIMLVSLSTLKMESYIQ